MITKTYPFILLIALMSSHILFAQECNFPSKHHLLNANNIEASIANSATLFDFRSNNDFDGTFKNKSFNSEAAAIFTNALWIGATKNSGDVVFSGTTYQSETESIFQSGPYPQNGFSDPNACTNYDQIFAVNRWQISNHQNDFADNGQLDDPVDEILGWPGRGNPNFESIHGFTLPENDTGSLAPFFDINADGIYNPYDGDYPLPNGVDPAILPEEILWWIINDANYSDPTIRVGIEVQVTVWAYQCLDNEVLNNAVFSTHKVTNYSQEAYEDLTFGLWTDFDLGCDFDDYFGCSPDQNTYFAYNADPTDGTVPSNCECDATGISTFCEFPPAVGISFLNHKMSAFSYYNRSSSTPPPPPGTGDPITASELLNQLKGKWADGQPITVGGDGRNLGSTDTTTFAFPGDPTSPDEWSMNGESLGLGDRRGTGSIDIGNLSPQQSFSVDMVYSSFQNPDLDHLGQVGYLLAKVEELQLLYDDGFSTLCTTIDFCEADCVWPGDTNSDGIVNYCDFFPIGLAFGEDETNRIAPIYWAPFDSEPWTNSLLDGTNHKHADSNGDGIINENDQDQINQFYNHTHGDYVAPPDQYQEGPELYFNIVFPINIEPFGSGESFFVTINTSVTDSLYGLSFELEYNWDYLESGTLPGGGGIWQTIDPDFPVLKYFKMHSDNDDGTIYLNCQTDGQNHLLSNQEFGFFEMNLKSIDFPIDPPCEVAMIRFKNIKGIRADGSEVSLGGTDLTIPLLCETTSVSKNDLNPISIHPNPTSDLVQINWNDQSAQAVEIIDITGKTLKRIQTANNQEVISLAAYAKGIYLIRAITAEGSRTFKVIKN